MIRADGNADRSADIDAVPVKLERLRDRKRDAPRDSLDVFDRVDVREENGEFVTG